MWVKDVTQTMTFIRHWVTQCADGRRFYGYVNKWNWMSYYGHADYTYNNLVQASVNVSVDGASSTGTSANRFYVYPSVGLVWLGKGWKPLQNSEWINKQMYALNMV